MKPFSKFANGGKVYGPGPVTSDSIPVMFDNSYIIPRRATKPPLGVIPGWLVKEQTGRDNLRIGVDLDGVCHNFEHGVREYLIDHHGYDAQDLPDPTEWHFHKAWGITREHFESICNDGVDAGYVFLKGVPYAGTVEGLWRLREAGHSIHIVTARFFGRPGNAQRNTMRWLTQHDVPFDTITFARDKTVVRTDYMIEDNIPNFDALQAAGTHAVLMDRPWNQDTPDRERSRVTDMLALADHIVGVAA